MEIVKRIPTEIKFEGSTFSYFTNNDGITAFDSYFLKSEPKKLIFEVFDDCRVIIYSCKLPTGKFGNGYLIDTRIIIADEANGKCWGTGIGGSKSFDSEFEAQLNAVKYVYHNCILSSFSSYLGGHMLKELQKFIYPNELF